MASDQGIAAVGRSLERFLTLWLAEHEPIDDKVTKAVLARPEDFENAGQSDNVVITKPGLTILVYRIDCDHTTRPGWASVGSLEGRARLPLEIRFLVTPWADNAQNELRILGCAMHGLDVQPVLSGPLLATIEDADWAAGEAVQVWLDSMTTDTVMETFETLPGPYKLSVPYVARVVRLDERTARPATPVVTAAIGTVAAVPEAEM